ncbi:MAG TPA: S8 family serine peptidase [Acidimicrobiales bacterium]|nr:S8 family serine peptidase [Acidimicrobiales bacterium]
MARASGTDRYVVLPPEGLRVKGRTATAGAKAFLQELGAPVATSRQVTLTQGHRVPLRVVDSLGDDGAKLVEATPESALAIRAMQPGLQVVPLAYYSYAMVRHEIREPMTPRRASGTAATVTLTLVSKKDKTVVDGAIVVAFTDFAAGVGAQGVSDAKGEVSLALGRASVTLDRLYVYPTNAFWTLRKLKAPVKTGTTIELQPIDLAYTDALRHYYGHPADDAGAGVTVAVIDSGVADHPDLAVSGGANTVAGEDPEDYGDNGKHHGTHVAGIVAARGTPPTGIRGVAPGVTLRSYRVFAKGSNSADSFAIAKAIDLAVADRCDLINMSLGALSGMPDPTLRAAVQDARKKGSLCIIAAGNGDRGLVGFPASEPTAVAVSALGRKGTFPKGTAEAEDVAPPFATDKAEFIGAFSNIGPQIDLTGPGVAIISTVPGSYTEISGTSMACPAVTGAAADVLASSEILKTPRDAARSEALLKALYASAKLRGLGAGFEGHGLPQPA